MEDRMAAKVSVVASQLGGMKDERDQLLNEVKKVGGAMPHPAARQPHTSTRGPHRTLLLHAAHRRSKQRTSTAACLPQSASTSAPSAHCIACAVR